MLPWDVLGTEGLELQGLVMPVPLPFCSSCFIFLPPQVLLPSSFALKQCMGFPQRAAEAQEQGHIPEVMRPALGLAAGSSAAVGCSGGNRWAVQ